MERSKSEKSEPTSSPQGSQSTSLSGFWKERYDLFRTVTLADIFSKFEESGALGNFDRVAVGKKGDHRGPPFFDGLVYETIRGAADFLANTYDGALDERLDGYIERISAAQQADQDGYINTFVTLTCPDQRWGQNGGNQLWHHEVYDAGCLVEAGTHHWLATNKTSLLKIAVKFANYMVRYIGPEPRHDIIPTHSLPEEALVNLYLLLRNEPQLAKTVSALPATEYLNLVRYWLEHRGDHSRRISFTEYAQDHMPLEKQQEAVGHSVRAVLCYTGMTAYGREAGDAKLIKTAQRLWENVSREKMHISGGVGPIVEYEGFGYGYYLPNDGYLETCAGIGMAFWGQQMLITFADASYADTVEQVLYNIALGSVSIDGKRYAYRNPLTGDGELRRWEWHSCPCCPPMLMKLMSSLPSLMYATGGDSVFVNQYVPGHSIIDAGNGPLEITQETQYPWDGNIGLKLNMDSGHKFTLRARIPSWCTTWSVSLNDSVLQNVEYQRGYAVIDRTWQNDDRIEIDLDMSVHRIEAHPSVQHNRGRVAIQRGPILFCFEAIDNDGETDLTLANEPSFALESGNDLPGGAMLIRGKAESGKTITAVPYFLRGNREDGADDFAVWLKQDGLVPRNSFNHEEPLYHIYEPKSEG